MKKIPAFLLILFITQNVWGDYITQNISDGCDDNYLVIDNNDHSNVLAIFTPNTHTCTSGEFLPANIDECRACPSNRTCTGGTYTFNENTSQGVSFGQTFSQSLNNSCIKDLIGIDNNNHTEFFAKFTPNSHTCSAGYYLPAGVDECTLCPTNNICIGGTYSFNETTDQGIQSCAARTFAPSGSAVCYPHILHIGNDVVYLHSEKQTTPSLNFLIGNDMFYANMTTTRTRMSKDSSHYFHAQWGNNDYYVCDDTTCPQ